MKTLFMSLTVSIIFRCFTPIFNQLKTNAHFLFETPVPKGRSFTIKLENVIPLSENYGKVGHEWKYYLSINDQIITRGEKGEFTINKRAPLIIEAIAIEEDKRYSDLGKKSLTIPYNDLIVIDKTKFQIDVTVVENGGNCAGCYAKWRFIVQIKQN